MRRSVGPLGLAACLCGLAFSQPAAKTPVFEAADVHVSPAGATQDSGFLPNGRVEFRATTLLGLIATAYSMPAEGVAGGPSWIDTDRYDVVAKASYAAPEAALRTMLQSLLAERFGLSIKREDKPRPVTALVIGKGG